MHMLIFYFRPLDSEIGRVIVHNNLKSEGEKKDPGVYLKTFSLFFLVWVQLDSRKSNFLSYPFRFSIFCFPQSRNSILYFGQEQEMPQALQLSL